MRQVVDIVLGCGDRWRRVGGCSWLRCREAFSRAQLFNQTTPAQNTHKITKTHITRNGGSKPESARGRGCVRLPLGRGGTHCVQSRGGMDLRDVINSRRAEDVISSPPRSPLLHGSPMWTVSPWIHIIRELVVASTSTTIKRFQSSLQVPLKISNFSDNSQKSHYTTLTAIQENTILIILARQDIMGCAHCSNWLWQTMAFLIPIIQRLTILLLALVFLNQCHSH